VKGRDEVDGILAYGSGGGGAGGRSIIDGGDAEALASGFGDEGFGVHGAGEMHVEVGALGEGFEEGVEFARAHLLCSVEGVGGAGFAGREGGRSLGLSDGTTGGCGDQETESDTSANHAQGPFQCFEFSKDTAGSDAVWRWGGGIAILWVDVLEGSIVRWVRNSLPHRQAKLRRTSPAGDLGCLRARSRKNAKAR
jgi:hypothetical protein